MIKEIPNNPGYFADENGIIYSNRKKGTNKLNILKTKPYKGYLRAKLQINGKIKTYCVHKLILETFVGPRPLKCMCRHLNDIKLDNRLMNLSWGTPAQNSIDKMKNHGNQLMVFLSQKYPKIWNEFLKMKGDI